MKKSTLLILAAAVFCFVACDNENIYEGTAGIEGQVKSELKVNAVISQNEPLSRAPQLDQNGSGVFTSGDKNQFLFLTAGNQVAGNLEYTYGKNYFWSDVNLSQDMTSGKVVAWYPAVATDTPSNFEWNVKTASDPDLLVAAPVAVVKDQKEPIQLVFKHKMHKLHVEVASGDASVTESDLAQASISCRNFHPSVSVNLLDGTTGAVSGNLHSLSVTDKKADFIVPAQPAGNIEVEVSVKGKSKVFKLSETEVNGSLVKQLESGKTLSLKVVVTKSEMKLTVATDIEGWENQGEKNDNIII